MSLSNEFAFSSFPLCATFPKLRNQFLCQPSSKFISGLFDECYEFCRAKIIQDEMLDVRIIVPAFRADVCQTPRDKCIQSADPAATGRPTQLSSLRMPARKKAALLGRRRRQMTCLITRLREKLLAYAALSRCGAS
jgi:hypothetical protein